MKNSRMSAPRRRTIVAAAAALAVGVGTLAAPAQAVPGTPGPSAAAPVNCPQPLALSQVTPGLVGDGWTVVQGTTPRRFGVKVLGVLTDGIGAGRDLIIIEAYDLPGQDFIAKGGIWAGMSGSPVYVGGKLLGAVSYGFTASPSPIAGVTPAADMMKLLGLSSVAAAKPETRPAKTKITMTANQRKAIDARAEATVPGATIEQLRTPMSVSGLNSRRLSSLQREFDAAGRSVIVYAGSRASGGTAAAATRPTAGGNFAAAVTYGDVSLAGIGTTTEVCGNMALAFGHPLAFAGKVTYGANDASSLTIIRDNTFGSFKLANVTGSLGTVDQDRMAGIRARLGAGPKTVPVTTKIHNLDKPGNSGQRIGTTQVAEPDYLALATEYGIVANYDSTFDKSGRGMATSSWTITGTRAGGKKLTVSRYNRWSATDDPTVGPAIEAANAVDALNSNEFEPVTITGVNFDSDISSAYQQLRITKMAVSVNGGKYTTPNLLRVKVGDTLKVRTTMRAYRSATDENLVISVKVPKNTAGRTGVLSAQGGLDAASGSDGPQDPGCLLTECDQSAGSLDAVIKDITSVPRNNQVVVDLSLDAPDTGTGKAIDVLAARSKRAPVTGQKGIEVEVR